MEKKRKSDTELQHDYRVFTDWIEKFIWRKLIDKKPTDTVGFLFAVYAMFQMLMLCIRISLVLKFYGFQLLL